MGRFRTVLAGLVLTGAGALAGAGAAPASAATPAPAWTIMSAATPTHFAPESSGNIYMVAVKNSGGTASSGTISVTDTLPEKLSATAIVGQGRNGEVFSCELATLTCTFSE